MMISRDETNGGLITTHILQYTHWLRDARQLTATNRIQEGSGLKATVCVCVCVCVIEEGQRSSLDFICIIYRCTQT